MRPRGRRHHRERDGRKRRVHLSGRGRLGEAAHRLGVRRRRRGRHRPPGPRLCVQPRRTSDVRVRPRRQFPDVVGRGRVPPRPRRPHGAGRHDLLHRRRRSHGAQVHARRQGPARDRHSGPAERVHERRAVQPLHAHGAVAGRRHLCLRRLRQCARAQVRPERQAADVVGRAGRRAGAVQPAAQHRLRCRRLGLCGRPREPSRAGVRRQRQVRDAVAQPASAERAVS